MATFEREHYQVNIRLAKVRATQLRKHAAWLQTAVGPASFQMQNDMHSAAERLEVLAEIVADLTGVGNAT